MGRPREYGLDHFVVCSSFFEDYKILLAQEILDPDKKDLNDRIKVPYVALFILSEIYKNGFYLKVSDVIFLHLANKCGLPFGQFKKIISALLESSYFDDNMYKKHSVLSSRDIQELWTVKMNNMNRSLKDIKEDFYEIKK